MMTLLLIALPLLAVLGAVLLLWLGYRAGFEHAEQEARARHALARLDRADRARAKVRLAA